MCYCTDSFGVRQPNCMSRPECDSASTGSAGGSTSPTTCCAGYCEARPTTTAPERARIGSDCGTSIDCAYGCGGPSCPPAYVNVECAKDGTGTTYDPSEPDAIIAALLPGLRATLADGGRKRAAGAKPLWKVDAHEGSFWSHVAKWKKGDLKDADSGVHPLYHASIRAAMLAWQEENR